MKFCAENLIVCGWYTPNYSEYARKLIESLEVAGLSYRFFECDEKSDHWENITMLKPSFVIKAMNEFPDKTILFIDVDCVIVGSADDIVRACDISGDIGFYVRSRYNRHKKVRFRPRSGALIIRPTLMARDAMETWRDISETEAPFLQVDESSLLVAIGRCPGLSVTFIPQEMTAIKFDELDKPLILHSSASYELGLHSKAIVRILAGYFGWRNWFPSEM